MFIVFVFYNNSEMYSYLHNIYIVNQQTINFITISLENGWNFRITHKTWHAAKHDALPSSLIDSNVNLSWK
jgi:hypothetical protein